MQKVLCRKSNRGKDSGIRGSGVAETRRNVAGSLFRRETGKPALKHNALAQLAELRAPQLFFQFGLAGENDLQEFAVGILQIQQ